MTTALADTSSIAPDTAGHGRHPVLRYLLRRIGAGIATLLAASMAIFAATQWLPGDAATAALGRDISPAALAAARERLGLDRPIWVQYYEWFSGFLRGDLGDSTVARGTGTLNAPVWRIIKEPLVNSVILAALAFTITVVLMMVLGSIAGLRANKVTDKVLSNASLTLAALPEFVLGAVLILVFFVWLDVLPPVTMVSPGASPLDDPKALVLPILTLVITGAAIGLRQVRASVAEAKDARYVTVARLNGLGWWRITTRYILRNSLATSIMQMGTNLQYLLGGMVLVEIVFAYPGIGRVLVMGVTGRDYIIVQDVTMILGAFYIAVNIIADLAVVFIVPKLRTSELG